MMLGYTVHHRTRDATYTYTRTEDDKRRSSWVEENVVLIFISPIHPSVHRTTRFELRVRIGVEERLNTRETRCMVWCSGGCICRSSVYVQVHQKRLRHLMRNPLKKGSSAWFLTWTFQSDFYHCSSWVLGMVIPRLIHNQQQYQELLSSILSPVIPSLA